MGLFGFVKMDLCSGRCRGGTRYKFWGGLQFFLTYTYELYAFLKRIKQYSPLNQE